MATHIVLRRQVDAIEPIVKSSGVAGTSQLLKVNAWAAAQREAAAA